MHKSPAMKRYNQRVIFLSLLYVLFLLAALYGFKRHLIEGPVAYVAAVLPALPLIGVFAAIGRYIVEEQDEYVRMLMIRQSLWATAITLSLTTAWGFLESFGLVGHIDAYYVAVLWFGGLGAGACINKLTLGATANC